VLTYRQAQILRAIRESISTRGIPPSMREIGDAVGLASANSVSYQIRQLRKYGYLVQVPPMGSSRRPAS
jgi:repressor LexA